MKGDKEEEGLGGKGLDYSTTLREFEPDQGPPQAEVAFERILQWAGTG